MFSRMPPQMNTSKPLAENKEPQNNLCFALKDGALIAIATSQRAKTLQKMQEIGLKSIQFARKNFLLTR